jgi:hypothetical protein
MMLLLLSALLLLPGPATAGDTMLFNRTDQWPIKHGEVLDTIPVLPQKFVLQFDLKPKEYWDYGLVSLWLQAGGAGRRVYGWATPYIYHKRGEMRVLSAINGRWDHELVITDNKLVPPVGAWSRITIVQEPAGSEYIFRVLINGTEAARVVNTQPEPFTNVTIRTWNQPGWMRNIIIRNDSYTTGTSSSTGPVNIVLFVVLFVGIMLG